MKRGLFIFGIGFLVLAFIAGAAEIAAQGVTGQLRAYMSVAEVWQVLSPATLEESRNTGYPVLGDAWQLIELMMLLPGWLLFGAPGFALAFIFRDRDVDADQDHEESVFLYDELTKQVHEEGMSWVGQGDDVMPSSHIRTEPAGQEMADERIHHEESDKEEADKEEADKEELGKN